MKKLSLAIIATVVIMPSLSWSQTSTETLISLKHGTASQVAAVPLRTADVKGFTIDVKGFGGLAFDAGKLTGGLTATHDFALGPSAYLGFGGFGQLITGAPVDFGLSASLGFRFTAAKKVDTSAAMTISAG